jgi:uncharacterized protein (TIGR03435 family)
MVHRILSIGVVTFFAGAAFAQSIVGTWQGSTEVNKTTYRAVVKISTTAGDSLGGAYYPGIDQSGASFPLGAVTAQGSTVRFSVPALGGTFEGKLDAGGNSLIGTWSLGDNHVTLTLNRATPQTAWAIPEPPPRPKALPADADPSFEVSTIKPVNPDIPGRYFRTSGTEFSTHNTSLADMISFAYGIQTGQILGAPAWVQSEKYDLQAKFPPEGMPSAVQVKTMLKKLMADRFQLAFHNDKKELSVYVIVVAKDGPKLTKSTGDPDAAGALFFRGLGQLPGRNVTMADLAGVMQSAVLDRPVIDKTGLPGRWDFSLNWTPDEFQFASFGPRPTPQPETENAPNLFTAFQQQLGLKLESTKAMADVFVVDKVAKPSDN